MAHYKNFPPEHALRLRWVLFWLSVRKIATRKRPFNLIIPDFDVKDGASPISPVFPVKATLCRGAWSSPCWSIESNCPDNIITHSADNNDPDNTQYPCLSPELVISLPVKPEIADKMIWINAGQRLQPEQSGRDGNPNGWLSVNADGDYSAGLSGIQR